MRSTLSLITAPASEPVTASEAKAHVRVDHTTEDTLITALITAARQGVEASTERQLISATWELWLDAFPESGEIWLPKPPLVSVTSVKYYDSDGVLQTLATSYYDVDAPAGPHAPRGRVRLAYDQSWPTTRSIANAVQVRYVAGWANAAAVPQELKQALLLRLGELYARREAGVAGTIFTETPAYRYLVGPYFAGGFV